MCGICGKLILNGSSIEREELIAMRDVLVHRGPDDEGIYIDENVGLGHRRLSIIDLAGSKQPLTNEDGTLWIVYNGEIYNYQELKKTLVSAGHQFRTKGDTEVIIHLYEEHGSECVQYLRGMFAFAIWDKSKRKLFLVRDRLGIKPLYYSVNAGAFYFASEIKALLKCKGISPELDETGLKRYLKYRFVYGEKTMFKGIFQLPPGTFIEVSGDRIKRTQYWNLCFSPKHHQNLSDLSEKILQTLDESVEMRMISDVPIGSFLSGGIDSSAITGLMASHSSSPVKTFSIGFVPEEENELKYAKLIADHFHSIHHEYTIGSEDFFSLMRKLVWHHDEPLMFPACIPLYILSRNSKQKATVILSGEGSDELFAGYTSNIKAYWLNRFMSMIPDPVKKLLTGMPLNTKHKEVMKKIGYSEEDFVKSFFTTYRDDMISRIYDFNRHQGDDEEELLNNELGMNDMEGTFLDRFLAFQMKTYLVALLVKQDKMSMAASIETRVPFLDHKLVELACRLPDSAKIKYTQGKYILKKACASLLPNNIIHRKKMGFPVPIESWFKEKNNPFIALLTDPEVRRNTFLSYDFIQRTIDNFIKEVPGSGRHLWVLLNLEIWRREFL